ncbi:MAG: TonB-dependent receptor plug domain-containing protein, partial [Dysgonamonadaceae bacterium]|nr:TonB-dependent receptor plug domain-containing protein [Dysgonamonadaceae bacterium]
MRNHFLFFCLLCFTQPVTVQEIKAQQVMLDSIGQKVLLLYDAKSPEYLTGAVSYISGDEIANVPGINRANTLSGRLTGFSCYNLDGVPGYENSTLRIRGVHTFSDNRNPLILIDGRIDDINSLDPYDIESVVVLKDAASTAMYGLRSTNGIILVNTKKGKEGKIKVNFNMETSFSQPTRLPKYLDSYQYATLYNEAQRNDDPNAIPRYDNEALEAYRTRSNPYKYPDVNWVDEFLKTNYTLTRANINV